MALHYGIFLLAFCCTFAYSTPVKRQADFWVPNNDLGNNWQGGFPNPPPSGNFPNWNGGNPSWNSQPNRPNRPPPRPTRPPPTRPTQPPPPPSSSEAPPGGQTLHTAPEGCACVKTGQFNPVCGTDTNTYANEALLKCFQNCGTSVNLRYMGACRRSG